MNGAYYNERDAHAAQWLRNLIAAGHIAAGVVDERSIEDVHPDDLRGFTQCHFFAGIGIWSHALRAAGWPDDRPVWTGSCPCQPFSAAGKGAGFADERHLWPAWHHLIRERRPAVVLGEQVASKDADPWIDLVQDDLEALGYAFGAVPFPAAGVGAPHIRDRLYWVAHSASQRRGQQRSNMHPRNLSKALRGRQAQSRRGGAVCGVEHPRPHHDAGEVQATGAWQSQAIRPADISGGPSGSPCGLADPNGGDASAERQQRGGEQRQQPQDRRGLPDGPTGPTNGHWRAADWLLCRDGRWRPVEPGSFPLVAGAAGRVGRLRAYGNGLCSPAAQAFIEAVMEAQP